MKRIIRMNKKKIRENLTGKEISKKSMDLINIFLESPIYKEANTIMSYMSIRNEIETSFLNKRILKDNKKLILPVIRNDNIVAVNIKKNDEFVLGKYQILEPKFVKNWNDEIDLILIPGIAFDYDGNRVGFGKGYYDKFLKKHDKSIRLGFLYDFQLVNKIEIENHDIKMDFLISNKGWEK